MVYTSTLSLYRQIRDEIKPNYGSEADMLAMFIVEDVSGFSSTDILTDHKFQTGPKFRATILKYILQLKKYEPIQYILGKAFFYENVFEVNESTLIPRPETEELVRLVLNFMDTNKIEAVLDVGTGSGCIAISVALNQPVAVVEGIDISTLALRVAERNAKNLEANLTFSHADIFTLRANKKYDLIVSNPPYVRESEKSQMNINVIDHEPEKALFVSDNDPLIFYKCITEYCIEGLRKGGGLFYEVNESFANDVAELLAKNNFKQIEVVKDINNKDRFVYGIKDN